MKDGHPFMKSLGYHEFHFFLLDEIKAVSPRNELYIISGGDYVYSDVFEIRNGEKSMRYRPYELYRQICEGRDFSETVENFLEKCRKM
jgi:hypothetical protein